MKTDTIHYAGGVSKLVEVLQTWETEMPSPHNRRRMVKVRCRRVRVLEVVLPPVGTIGFDERQRALWSNPAHIGKEFNEYYRPGDRTEAGSWMTSTYKLEAPAIA